MELNIGSKAINLKKLRDDFGYNVPDFIAIPFSEIIQDFEALSNKLTSITNDFLQRKASLEESFNKLSQELERVQLNVNELQKHTTELLTKRWVRVSYRTSASLEDGAEHSFAGQYESFLDQEVTRESLQIHVLKSFRCLFSERVINYARARGLTEFQVSGSLIVQEMFFGEGSGVAFSENGAGKIQITYVNSWRNTVVEGENASDVLIDRTELEQVKISPILRELAEKVLALELATGLPVDVEWAYRGNKLMFLQFRPITNRRLDYSFEWDSTNISENYPGITLPLTYSLIRQFYAGVYMAFFKMLGAKPSDIQAKQHVADNMLGYLNGRVYYRISNWYEAIKLVPGRFNQEFFEGMLNPVKRRGKAERAPLDFKSLVALSKFLRLVLRSEKLSRRFSKQIADKISFYDAIDFGYINASAIVDASRKARTEILQDWSMTILNDVRLMVFHGILQKLYSKNQNPNDYLNMIQGLNDRASIKPLEALSKLGEVVKTALQKEEVAETGKLLGTPSWPTVRKAAMNYITAFGARTPGELKLENTRITDHVETILGLAHRAADSGISATATKGFRVNVWPENQNLITKPLVLWVAKNTRRAIDWRERFRFNRAQTFNLSRKAFDAIGDALVAEGIIDTARDIYWLTDQEVDELVNAHAPLLSGKAIVALRKKEFEKFEKLELGLAVSGAGRIAAAHLTNTDLIEPGTGLHGNGVAPGEVTAEAVVMLEFNPDVDVRGKVLVVQYIDPGWTLLFTQASAIVAERGNALSHAAIISREIGIPAVVAATTATRDIKTGQTITVNGTIGSIKIESI